MQNCGITYMGSRNVTTNGRVCQPWTSDRPHKISADITDSEFPDNSIEEAKNFCRNPLSDDRCGIWCYTMDPVIEYELCEPIAESYGDYRGRPMHVRLSAVGITHMPFISNMHR